MINTFNYYHTMSDARDLPATTSADGLVGRGNELRLLRQAVRLRRPVLLLGPPGVSKTTMLRVLAGPVVPGREPVHWVTGDEQLSAHALVGTFDPSLVLREGYLPAHFSPGPLVRAMREGGILYIEELNRAPSGALNVLITALSDRHVEVAHLGRVQAAPGFMVAGSANPLDDIGTGRLSRGLLDRFLVLEIGYQPREEEIEIVLRNAPGASQRLAVLAVDVARATRDHPDFRYGASIRAAIDLASLLAAEADALRGAPGGAPRGAVGDAPEQKPVAPRGGPGAFGKELDNVLLRCLVCAAFVGRVRLRPAATRSACDLVMELFNGLARQAGGLGVLLAEVPAEGTQQPGESGGPQAEPGADPSGVGGSDSRGKPDRDELPGLERSGGSGEAGQSRSSPMTPRDRPVRPGNASAQGTADSPLADFGYAVRKAAELVLRVRGTLDDGAAAAGGRWLRSMPWRAGEPGELDVAATAVSYAENGGLLTDGDIRVLRRAPEHADYLILIDHSGSMAGRKLALAAVLAAVVAQLSEAGRARYGVLAFDEHITALKELDEGADIGDLVERILLLPEGKATDLSLALRAAADRMTGLPAAHTVLISDCMPTRGQTGFGELAGLAARVPSLHICYIDDHQPVIELHGGAGRLNLYQWWARRWVGDQRVYNLDQADDLDAVVEGISEEEP